MTPLFKAVHNLASGVTLYIPMIYHTVYVCDSLACTTFEHKCAAQVWISDKDDDVLWYICALLCRWMEWSQGRSLRVGTVLQPRDGT
jgi:hypothetical protein